MREDIKNIEFLSRYYLFVAEHGELFEMKEVPLDDSDRDKVRSFYRVCYGFFFVTGAGFIALMYFNFPKTTLDILYAIIMGSATVCGPIWCYISRNKALKFGFKTVIKGIITEKKARDGSRNSTNSICLSQHEQVKNILEKDFDQYNYGDIVQAELLGSSWLRIASTKVIYLGKMTGEVPLAIPKKDPNSFWSKAGKFLGMMRRR